MQMVFLFMSGKDDASRERSNIVAHAKKKILMKFHVNP